MLALELIIKTRKFVKDLGKTNYDDFEIIDAINDAARLLAEVNAQTGRPYFRKNTTISSGDSLPDDFIRDSHVINTTSSQELFRILEDVPGENEYTITGNTFTTGDTSGTYRLLYFYRPETIASSSSTINIPNSMVMPISKLAAYILQDSDSSALTMAQFFMGATSSSSSSD